MAFTYLSRCDWSGSHSATSSTLGSDVQALTWLIPRPPQPTTAMRTVLLALASMAEEVVATAAVVIRKFRRFMGPPGQFLGTAYHLGVGRAWAEWPTALIRWMT